MAPSIPEPTSDRPNLADWRRLHAFGWPGGSVRALMAILIFATLWGHLVLRPEREVPESLRDLLFIILGHYFAVRSRSDAGEVPGPPPLYLPRGAVRFLLFAGSLVVGIYLFRRGSFTKVHTNPGVITLLLVFGFLLGVGLQKVLAMLRKEGHPLPRWLEDTRAGISLLAAIVLCLLVWDGVGHILPVQVNDLAHQFNTQGGRYGPENVLAAVVGFYFGSRS